MIAEEGDIRIDIINAVSLRKFDDDTHGLSHCMKAVDFIIELEKSVIFLEIKDPQSPHAHPEKFIEDFTSYKLINDELKPKCRDSFIYEYSMNRVNKPIFYIALICLDTITEPELSAQADLLRKNLPVDGPPKQPWIRKFIETCAVLNIAAWRKTFPHYPIIRLSEQ